VNAARGAGDWKSPSVVQGQTQSSSRGLRDQVPQKLKRYGEWRGNIRYRVTDDLSSAGSRGSLI